jgi:hypothetical protein
MSGTQGIYLPPLPSGQRLNLQHPIIAPGQNPSYHWYVEFLMSFPGSSLYLRLFHAAVATAMSH